MPPADRIGPTEAGARERFPIAPDTVTVLGYRVREHEPRWQGLDFSRATLRQTSTIMVYFLGDDAPYDLHLNVPFCYPGEPPARYEGCKYRVRPQAEAGRKWRGRKVVDVAIEPDPDKSPPWEIIVTFERPATPGPTAAGDG